MAPTLRTRFIVAASLLCGSALFAQSAPPLRPSAAIPTQTTLPPTPTTTSFQAPPTPAQLPPAHAQVAYANGTLSIAADNASLNQILRQVSEQSGMKITGGVADERVFGHYGPGAPTQVLADLLDGTASNVLFVASTDNQPSELVLTPRNGGPTPANPNAAAFREDSDRHDLPPQLEEAQPPADPTPDNNSAAVPPVATAPAEAAPADPNQPQSPNGVKTPQQIFEQLQRMRQQQQPQSSPQ